MLVHEVQSRGFGRSRWAALLAGLTAVGCAGATPLVTVDRSGKVQGAVVLPDGSKVILQTGLKVNDVNFTLSVEKKLDAPAGADARSLWTPDVPGDDDRRKIRLEGDVSRARLFSETADWGVERTRLDGREGVPGPPPAGKAVLPLPQRGGRWSNLGRPLVITASSEAAWSAVRAKLFGGLESAPRLDPVDFATQVVLVVSDGDGADCSGIRGEAWDDGSRLLVRLERNEFRTLEGAEAVRAFGVFVLPRTGPRTLVVQSSRPPALGGVPLWGEHARLELPADPARELDPLKE
jgi:hypothetical protein